MVLTTSEMEAQCRAFAQALINELTRLQCKAQPGVSYWISEETQYPTCQILREHTADAHVAAVALKIRVANYDWAHAGIKKYLITGVYIPEQGPASDNLALSLHYAERKPETMKPYQTSMEVAAQRQPTSVAQAVIKRLLPDIRTVMMIVRAREAEQQRERQQILAIRSRLLEAVRLEDVQVSSGELHVAEATDTTLWYRSPEDMEVMTFTDARAEIRTGTASVAAGGAPVHRVSLDLRYATPELAEEVLATIARYVAKQRRIVRAATVANATNQEEGRIA